MANLDGPLAADTGSGVGAPQQISTGFTSWLRYCSDVVYRRAEAYQTLHDVRPSAAATRYVMYIWGGAVAPDGISPRAKFTLRPSLALCYIGSVTAWQLPASAKLCGVVQGMELSNFRRRRHLYSAGRPSRWASAHILVLSSFLFPRLISAVAD